MIEIEVEMDSDVLAAEAASNAVCYLAQNWFLYPILVILPNCLNPSQLQESIAEQIQQIIELENLEEVGSLLAP